METRRDVPVLDLEGDIRARREGQGILPDDDRAKLGGPLSPRPEGGVPLSGIHHERHDPFEGRTDLFPQTVPPAGKLPSGHGKFDLKPEETSEPPVAVGKETQRDSAPGEGIMHAHIMKDDYFDVSESRSALPRTDVHGKDESSGVITDNKHRPEEHEGRSGEGGGIIDVNSLKDDYIDLSEDRSALPEADVLRQHKNYGVIPKEEHPSEETTGRSDGGGGGLLDVNSLKDDYVDLSEDRIALSDAHGKHEIYRTMREEEPLPKETKDQSPHAKGEGTEDALPLKDGQGELSEGSSAFSGTDADGRDERCGALQEEELTPKETQVQFAGGGGIIDVHDLKDDYVDLSGGLQEPDGDDCSSDDVRNQDTAKLIPPVKTSVAPDQSEAAAIYLPTADPEGSQSLEEAKDEGTAQLTSQSRSPADEPTQHDTLEGHSPIVDREQSQAPGDSKHEDTAQLTSQIKSPADGPRQEEAREIHSPVMSPKHLPQTAPQNDDDLKTEGSQHDDSSLKVEKQEETAQLSSEINPPMDELEEQQSPHVNRPDIDPQQSERVLPDEEDAKHPGGQSNLESINYDEGLEDNGRREVVKGGSFNNRDADPECSDSPWATINGSSDAARDLQAESTATKQDENVFPEEVVGVQDGNDVDRPEKKVPDPTYVMGGRPECGIVVPDDGGRNAQENNKESSGDVVEQDAPRGSLSDGKHEYKPPLNVDFGDDRGLSHPAKEEGLGSDSPLVNLSGDGPEVSQEVLISEGEPERKPSSYASEEACDTEQTQSASEQVHVSRTIPGDTFNEDLKNDKQAAAQEAYQPEQALYVEPHDIRATDTYKSEEAEEEISQQVGMQEVNVGRDEDVLSKKSVDTARPIADIREEVGDKMSEEKNNDILLDKNVGEGTVLDQQIRGEEGRREVTTFVDEDKGDVEAPSTDSQTANTSEGSAEEQMKPGSEETEINRVVPDDALTEGMKSEQSAVEPQIVNYEVVGQGEEENVKVEGDSGDKNKEAVPILDNDLATRPDEQKSKLEVPITDSDAANPPEASAKDQISRGAEEAEISSGVPDDALPEGRKSDKQTTEQQIPLPDQVHRVEYGDVQATDRSKSEVVDEDVLPPYVTKETDERRDGAFFSEMTEECDEVKKSEQSAVEPQIANNEVVGQGEEENVKVEDDSGDKDKEAAPILDNDLAIRPDEQNPKLEAPITDSDAANPPEASAKYQISRGAEEAEISCAVPDDELSEGRKRDEQTTEQQIPSPEQVHRVEYGDVQATDRSKSEVVDEDVVPPYVTKETDERRDGASLSETTEECAEVKKSEQSAVEPKIANDEVMGQGEEENVKVEGDSGDKDKEAVPILDIDLATRPDEQNPKLEAPIRDSDVANLPEASAKEDQISRGTEEAEISCAVPDDALSEGRKSDEQTTEQQIPLPEQATDRSKSEVVDEDVVPPYVTKKTDERRDGASPSETTEECAEVRKSEQSALEPQIANDETVGQGEGENVKVEGDSGDKGKDAVPILDNDLATRPDEQNPKLEAPITDSDAANPPEASAKDQISRGAEEAEISCAVPDDALSEARKSDEETTEQQIPFPEQVHRVEYGDVQATDRSEDVVPPHVTKETDERRDGASLSETTEECAEVRKSEHSAVEPQIANYEIVGQGEGENVKVEGDSGDKDKEAVPILDDDLATKPDEQNPKLEAPEASAKDQISRGAEEAEISRAIPDNTLSEGMKSDEQTTEQQIPLPEQVHRVEYGDVQATDRSKSEVIDEDVVPPYVTKETDERRDGALPSETTEECAEVRKGVGEEKSEETSNATALDKNVKDDSFLDRQSEGAEERQEVKAPLKEDIRDITGLDEKPEQVEDKVDVKDEARNTEATRKVAGAEVVEQKDDMGEGDDAQSALEPNIVERDIIDLPEEQNVEVKGDSGDGEKPCALEEPMMDDSTANILQEVGGVKKSCAEDRNAAGAISDDKLTTSVTSDDQTTWQETHQPERVLNVEHGNAQATCNSEAAEEAPYDGMKKTDERRDDPALSQKSVDVREGVCAEKDDDTNDAIALDKNIGDDALLDEERKREEEREEIGASFDESRRDGASLDEEAKDLGHDPALSQKSVDVREGICAEKDEETNDAIALDKNIGDDALLDEERKREGERGGIGASLDESRRDGASFDEEAKDLGHGSPQVEDKAEEVEIGAKGLDDVMERKDVSQGTDEQLALEPQVVIYDNTRDLPEEQKIEMKGDSEDGDKQPVIETAIVDGKPNETVGEEQLKSDAEEGDVTETIPCDKRDKQTEMQEICQPEQVSNVEHGEVQARETCTSKEGDEDLPQGARKATDETRGDATLSQKGWDMVDGSGGEVLSDATPLDMSTRDVAPLDEQSNGAKDRREATFPPHEDRRNVCGVDEQAKDSTGGPAEVAEKTGGEEVRETSVAEVEEQETGGRGADEHCALEPQSRNYDIIDRPERELEEVKSESGDAKMKDGSRDGGAVVARSEDCRPESPGARDEEPVPKFQGTELREVVEQEEERKQTDDHPLEKPSQEEGGVDGETPLTALQRHVDSMTAEEDEGFALKEGEVAGVHRPGKEDGAQKQPAGAGAGGGGYEEEEGPKEGLRPPAEDPNTKTSVGERRRSRDLAEPPPPDDAHARQQPPKKGVFQRLKEKLTPTYHSQ